MTNTYYFITYSPKLVVDGKQDVYTCVESLEDWGVENPVKLKEVFELYKICNCPCIVTGMNKL